MGETIPSFRYDSPLLAAGANYTSPTVNVNDYGTIVVMMKCDQTTSFSFFWNVGGTIISDGEEMIHDPVTDPNGSIFTLSVKGTNLFYRMTNTSASAQTTIHVGAYKAYYPTDESSLIPPGATDANSIGSENTRVWCYEYNSGGLPQLKRFDYTLPSAASGLNYVDVVGTSKWNAPDTTPNSNLSFNRTNGRLTNNGSQTLTILTQMGFGECDDGNPGCYFRYRKNGVTPDPHDFLIGRPAFAPTVYDCQPRERNPYHRVFVLDPGDYITCQLSLSVPYVGRTVTFDSWYWSIYVIGP